MRKDRTEYWKEYAIKNADKRRLAKAAYRERNKDKIKNYAGVYRSSSHSANRTPSAPRKPQPIKIPAKITRTEEQEERFQALRERFAAFRTAKLKQNE
jgi:hypothetical protein